MRMVLRADFETRSACDLKRAGADLYSKHSTTEALCMAFSYDFVGSSAQKIHLWKMGEAPSPELKEFFNFIKLDGAEFRAYNVGFEIAIWNNVMMKKHGWPMLLPSQCTDTMAKAYAMALPGSLEKVAPAVGLTSTKDMAGSRVMMQLSRPREILEDGTPIFWEKEDVPDKFEKLYAYCIQDLKVEMEVDQRLVDLPAQEKRVWQLDYAINQRGIRVDLPAVKKALELVEFEKDRLNKLMKNITVGAVSTCTATGQLTDWVGWQLGEELDGVAKADVLALLARENLPTSVRTALTLRQEAAKSSTAKLKSMLDAAGEGERVRGTKQYHGAGTGRWAGRKLQVDNFPRGNLSIEDVESVFELLRSE